jgi:hypothetical protein
MKRAFAIAEELASPCEDAAASLVLGAQGLPKDHQEN